MKVTNEINNHMLQNWATVCKFSKYEEQRFALDAAIACYKKTFGTAIQRL